MINTSIFVIAERGFVIHLPMHLRKLFEKVGLNNLKLNLGFMEAEFDFSSTADKEAAWEMYVELITRVSTQPHQHGENATALMSLVQLFPLTRQILKEKGREAINFAKIAVIVLNQVIRPFTSKWHSRVEELKDQKSDEEFRQELAEVQVRVKQYARLLAEILEIEDISDIEC